MKSPRTSSRDVTPSSCSTKPGGIRRPSSTCPTTSRSCRCRPNVPNSILSRMSGSSCATTGSQTASSSTTTTSSITAATPGTSSEINPGASCPSAYAIGRTSADQRELVLPLQRSAQRERPVKSPPPASRPVEGRELFVGQRDRGGADVLLEMRDLAGAGDRQHDGAALQEPGEGDLAGARLVLAGDRVERRPLAREFSGAERGPGDEADVVPGAMVERR